MPSSPALRLPNEILLKVAECLDFQALIAFRQTCRRLKEVIDRSSSCRYIIELAENGMCDGVSGSLGPSERLRSLREFQAAWKTPGWIQGYHWPQLDNSDQLRFPAAVSGNVLAHYMPFAARGTGELLVQRFPSKWRGIPGGNWRIKLDSPVRHVHLDDSQDLLILVSEFNAHIRALSTGRAHPCTLPASETIDLGADFAVIMFTMDVYDDLVVVHPLRSDSSSSIARVWSWKTGELLAVVPCPWKRARVSLLDANYMLFTSPSGPEHLVLEVVGFRRNATNPSKSATCTYRFGFSYPVVEGPKLLYLSSGTLRSNGTGPDHRATQSLGFFYTDPQDRLLVLHTHALDRYLSPIVAQDIYVPTRALLSHISSHPFDGAVVDVPWREWGPGNTRVVSVADSLSNRILHRDQLCGMRVLNAPDTRRKQSVRVTDYHPRRVTSVMASGQHPCLAWEHDEGELSRTVKDIPLPEGLKPETIAYVLCEDVIVLLSHSNIFYHPV
ncbi:hypothetical protein BC834DRAFT_907057 [Gloeopeniophorella convolvens]|nr:hypothetical protein BC834DRAFT_907057 [Gloeopeniophorella convolvens]